MKLVRVYGIVQSVGFRPFVFRLANELNLVGFVQNRGSLVEIFISGSNLQENQFLKRLISEAPPLAQIDKIEIKNNFQSKLLTDKFIILKSEELKSDINVSADSATCIDCVKDIFDPNDRRFLYPFTNCTNCGPRYTIIESLPYDRAKTTMKTFFLCEDCNFEYQNQLDRRFHAEPIACAKCGPRLSFRTNNAQNKLLETLDCDTPRIINRCIETLRNGEILALKSLGGYQLICDACSDLAVGRLRLRKKRPTKPLAVMFENFESLQEHCFLNESDLKLLTHKSSPIVLLPQLSRSNLSRLVNHASSRLGAFLPYTPLHHILLKHFSKPLIVTSGNLSEEPIAITAEEAKNQLETIADSYLEHDRNILSRCDDSVVLAFKEKGLLIRRARGFAPEAIALKFSSRKVVLALGGQLKSTFCIFSSNKMLLSPHIGDLSNAGNIGFFRETLHRFRTLFEFVPNAIACDLHPNYFTSQEAQRLAAKTIPIVPIQHHFAHILSCMVENGLNEKVIGVAFDGTGYGDDGNIWGGEFLIAEHINYKRVARLKYVKMAGADRSIIEPWRSVLAFFGSDITQESSSVLQELNYLFSRQAKEKLKLVLQQFEKNINTIQTSSVGRLFDAAAAILCEIDNINFEAEAAILLEKLASQSLDSKFFTDSSYVAQLFERYGSSETILNFSDDIIIVDPIFLLRDICKAKRKGIASSIISLKFHLSMAKLVLKVCVELRSNYKLQKICLSGGVFQNSVFLNLTVFLLEQEGFNVFYQEKIPCNDGGLSLGQALGASATLGYLDNY